MTAFTETTIRDARPADVPRLLVLLQQLSEQSTSPEAEVRPATEAHYAALRRITEDPNARLLVAEQGGAVIGTLTLYVMPNLSHGGAPFAIVENVVVDAALRGGGHGRLLMAHAEKLAQEAGCYKVSLTSNNKRVPAHAFYNHIGYTNSHKGFTRYLAPMNDEPGTMNDE
jgi:GNAT superfamily N-acetyltransferase